MNRTSRLLLPAAVAGLICQAQTQSNFSQYPSTKPFKVGATLPATCSVGEAFFNTSATAGANWYGCVATNVWAVESGSGTGSGGITQLTGDVAAGPGSGAQTATIQPGAVTLSKMANLAAGSIICNNTASAATPIACTPAQVNALLAASGGGGGGDTDSVASSQLTDFAITKTSGAALTVNPGTYRVGYATYSYAGSTTLTLTQYTIIAVGGYGTSGSLLTLSGSPPLGTIHYGDTFYVSGAKGNGCTGLNALQTVVNLPAANQVAVTGGNGGSCTYTANSAVFAANPSASGTGYIYGDNQGNLTVMMPASVGLLVVPSGTPIPITIQSSTPGFGAGSVPIAQITFSSAGNGNWNAVTDQRAFMSTTGILAGAGLLTNEAGGIWTLGIDPSVVPELGAGNTWTGANDFSGANSTSPLKVSASAPATCSVGQYYFNSANSHTYACTASNTWSQVDGGSALGVAGGGSVTTTTTTTETIDLPVGTCDYSAAGHTLWWSTSNTSPAGCFSGSTASAVPIIQFGTSGTATGRPHLIVPFGWASGTVNLYLYGYNVSGGPSPSTYSVQTQCYSPSNQNASPASPGAYNTAQTLTTTPGSGGSFITQLSNLTMTGCSAGNILDILLTKTSANVSDLVYGVYLTIVRNL